MQSTNLTFAIIKPEVVKAGKTSAVLADVEANGFEIKAIKKINPGRSTFEFFYMIHKDRPFYNELVDYMSSGPVFVMVLKKDEAVTSFRKLIGATNPAEAAEGTIRQKYGTSIGENAIHGSDSNENALIEMNQFFSHLELV